MGPLNLEGWVTPEQEFGGLYKISDDLRYNRQLEERKAEREQHLKDREDARRNSLTGLLREYTNPKDYLSGTVQDPHITQGVAKILQTGVDLINQNKGLDGGMLMSVLAPMVNKLSTESQNLKTIRAKKDEILANAKSVKGIDIDKLSSAYDDAFAYNTDANGNKKLKDDLSTIDPTGNYGDKALQSDVFTNEGLNDFVKTAGHTVLDQNIKTRDAKGRVHEVKVDITKPNFMVQDNDEQGVFKEFVPDFDVATEGDAALIHTFKDDKGNEVKAPVRVVKDYVWNNLPKTSKGYILQEVRGILKNHPEIPIGSQQAENLGKAIAYDELKDNAKDWSTMKRTDVNLQPLPPRVSVTVNNKNADEENINNLYGRIEKQVDNDIEGGTAKGISPETRYTRVNALDADAISLVTKIAKEANPKAEFNIKNLFLHRDVDGRVKIYRTSDEKGKKPIIAEEYEIGALSRVGTNFKVQPGVAEKRGVVKKGESNTKNLKTISKKSTGKWDKYAE